MKSILFEMATALVRKEKKTGDMRMVENAKMQNTNKGDRTRTSQSQLLGVDQPSFQPMSDEPLPSALATKSKEND